MKTVTQCRLVFSRFLIIAAFEKHGNVKNFQQVKQLLAAQINAKFP